MSDYTELCARLQHESSAYMDEHKHEVALYASRLFSDANAAIEAQAREIAELQQENAALSDVVSTLNSAQVTDYATIDALRARAEAAEKAIKDYNDSCIGACEYRVKTNHCEAYLGRGRNCPDCPRDDVIDYPAAIAAGGDDAKD